MLASLEQKRKTLKTLATQKDSLVTLKKLLDFELCFQEFGLSGTPLARMDIKRMIENKHESFIRARILREAYNFYKAVQHIDRLVLFSHTHNQISDLELIHHLLSKGITPKDTQNLNAEPEQTEEQTLQKKELLTELFMKLKANASNQHVIKQMTDFYIQLLNIKAFTYANDRCARLMLNLMLMQNGYPPALLHAEDRITHETSLRHCSRDQGYLMCELLVSGIERALDFCIDTIERLQSPIFVQSPQQSCITLSTS